MKTLEDRLWEKVDRHPSDPEYASKGCWKWTAGVRGGGYGCLKVSGKMQYAHRVAFELVNGAISDGAHILHSCDNPACVNPSHLREGTHAENMEDMANKGRGRAPRRPGQENCNAKLTESHVVAIHRLNQLGYLTQYQIASLVGTSRPHVSRIIRGVFWPHIKKLVDECPNNFWHC